MRKITITIKDRQGKPKSIFAYEYSKTFAIHRSVYDEPSKNDYWTITHRPTGLAFLSGIHKRAHAVTALNMADIPDNHPIHGGDQEEIETNKACKKLWQRVYDNIYLAKFDTLTESRKASGKI